MHELRKRTVGLSAIGGLTMWLVQTGLAMSAGAQAPPASVLGPRIPNPAEDEAVATRVCVNCHGPEHMTGGRRSRDQWEQVLENMATAGAKMNDEEYGAIMRYLLATSGRTNVNRDAATDLSAVLHISAEDAARIVEFRKHNGPFAGFDQLVKVPSIDVAAIEARRDAIVGFD